MLINRIGDLGLAIGICAIFLTFKTLDYVVVFAMTPKAINCNFNFLCFDFDRLTLISFLLFWGAIGKSAQIGLHVWLPDAMEGPTPVSALIHAATLVTAGIFVLVRCSIIFENSHVLLIISFFGALTAFFASTVGLVQNDMKRVIAFSTCSQLGYMSFCASLSHFSIAFFHLANHALFKALLFLSAGCVIHGICDEQDMRKMGGLLKTLPLAYTMILIGSLALVGFPFLTGFYSKDAILEVALSKHNFAGNLAHFLGVCAAFCTSFYSFRLIFLVFVNETNSFKSYFKVAHDAPILMCFPLFFLAAGAIGFGFLSRDFVIGLGSPFFGASLFYNTKDFNLIDSEFLPAVMKNIPFFCTLLGFMLSVVLINCFNISKRKVFSLKMSSLYQKLYIFLTQKWHCDQILNELGAIRLMNFGYTATFKLMDKGIIEILGPSGFTFNVQGASYQFSKLQNGLVANYALFFSVALLFFLLCFCFSIFQLSLFTINNSVVALVFSYFLFSFFVIS